MIAGKLGENECGAFLIWGDPALYDSTLRIVEPIRAQGRGRLRLTRSFRAISSVQALAAAHGFRSTGSASAIHITTGRNLAAGLADGFDNVVVMLDGQCAFKAITDAEDRHLLGRLSRHQG